MKLSILLAAITAGCSALFLPLLAADTAELALAKIQSGDYEGAQSELETSSSRNPFGTRLLIELLERKGWSRDADSAAEGLIGAYRNGSLPSPSDLEHVAYAAWHLQRWEEANEIFIEASEGGHASPSMYVDWGHLYLEKYQPGEAESIFRDGLELDESQRPQRWTKAHLHLGLAQAIAEQSKPGSSTLLEQAGSEGGAILELSAYQALQAIREEDWSGATRWIEEGLEQTPQYLPLLELRCAQSFVQGDEEIFQQCEKEVLEINPYDADLYEMLGDLSVSNRRLDEAIRFYEQALEKDPRQWSALASKGINQLRLGREDEGIAALEEAYRNDPYNIWTVNTLRLVDSFEKFERFETPHFTVRLHRKESTALRPYVEDLLERSLNTLEDHYRHQVDGKIVFEMYPDHDDFAVRTLGLPGLGAFGAAFGQVVAMDSPSARPKGEFHWASTLWHEMAHVVTLSLSNNKVPRWLTEGISMMEERRGGAGWGDGLSISFVKAYESGELLPLSELNSGFQRPKSGAQLSLSYFQAGWICELIEREYGRGKLIEMLVAYGEGLETEEVFKTVLGKSVSEIDDLFQSELESNLGPMARSLEIPESLPNLAALLVAQKQSPDNYFINIAVAEALIAEDRGEEALPYLRKAIELFPDRADTESPYALLAAELRKMGRTDELASVLSEWWRRSPLRIETAFELCDLLTEAGDIKGAVARLEEAIYTQPLSPELHSRLGDGYAELDEYQKAIREYQVLLSLNPVDRASSHLRLAKVLNESGSHETARHEVLLALEIAPGYEEAQKLLLDLVRKQ